MATKKKTVVSTEPQFSPYEEDDDAVIVPPSGGKATKLQEVERKLALTEHELRKAKKAAIMRWGQVVQLQRDSPVFAHVMKEAAEAKAALAQVESERDKALVDLRDQRLVNDALIQRLGLKP